MPPRAALPRSPILLSQLARSSICPPRPHTQPYQPRPPSTRAPSRPFFSLPTAPTAPQELSATRTLPYTHTALFDLIADIDAYATFVPYCRRSRVTRWTEPDPSPDPEHPGARGRRWPAEADLHVGWGGFDDVFSSRVSVVPGRVVEARSGGARGGDGSGDTGGSGGTSGDGGAVFQSLVTRWSFRPLDGASTSGAGTAAAARPSTEVKLWIQFQFANPLYAAVSAAVSDKVAATMIEAFEQRARQVLGDPTKARS